MPATDDRLMRPRASLPLAAIDSLAHLSPPVDDSRTTSCTATVHHHHSSKSENFRRLEDRMDQLHEEIMTTQRLVQALATTLATEKRRSTTRQTLRTQSSKSIQRTHTPVDTISPSVGPPSSLPVTASILLSLSPSPANTNGRTDPDVSSPEPQDAVRDLPARKASHVDHRKHSATNPLTLLAPKHGEGKQSMSLAVAHASTFIAEVTNAASAKHIATRDPAATLSRRFSLSSLDLSTPTDTRVNRVVQWSRNLFRARIESVVSPEEIQDARRAYTKLHRFSIRHNSVQRMVWDTVVILMILVDIVVTPLALSFRFFPHGIATYNTIGNLVFASDFVVHLLSSYTTPRGVLVSGPRHTIQHYLTSPWALADFLSWFPFEVFASEQGQFLGVAKVIRLAKVSQLARRLHSAQNAGLFRFVKLLGIVFIVSHCLSCYWNWVAVDWRHAEVGYLAMTPGQQYAHCWSMVIGSLNASPPAMYTTIEEVSVAIFMLIGNVLQATVFGSVAVLIQSFGEDEVAYNKKLISTYERCRFLDIPEKLARRIQGYYENLYQETRSVDPDADAFINELSPALICEVKFQLYREMIKQIPFLSATHINPVVIEMLILHLRTVIYMQDDVLIRKGEVGDWMGFIGSKGSVGVLDPASEVRKIIRILRKGDYFGEMALLQRAKRSTTAIALTWVQIHVLCRTDLDDVKAQYPEQAEILEQEITKYMQTKVTYK